MIQKINNNNNISEWRQNPTFSMPRPILPSKSIDTKDFLYQYPIISKSQLTFGHNVEKAKSFEDSIEKYFPKLPEGAKYDKFQLDSARVVYEGNDAITIAPTGTGKTAITNYTVAKNLAEGKDTYCTFPIKALTNEKYDDFCKLYGKENVGLLTGDIKINPNAPVQLMTTEIYRNKILGKNNDLHKLASVVHDEFHTINDLERGEVYETAIMYTPAKVQQVLLSGTIENGEELETWLNRIQLKKNEEEMINSTKKAVLVKMSVKERHVPLKYFIYNKESNSLIPLIVEKYNIKQIADAEKQGSLTEKQKEVLTTLSKLSGGNESIENGIKTLSEIASEPSARLENLEQDLQKKLGIEEMEAKRMAAFMSDPSEKRFNIEELGLFNQLKKPKVGKSLQGLKDLVDVERLGKVEPEAEKKSFATGLINLLNGENQLPSIIFKLSKKGSNSLQKDTMEIPLLNEEEKKEAAAIIKKFKDDKQFLGTNFDEESLLSGSATHHSGKMPGYKKLVETLAQKKLIKAIYATGTLGAGINVPAKDVVMTQLDRVVGKDEKGKEIYQDLSINEIHQMIGRAGRRGKDKIGNVIFMPDGRHSPEKIYQIVTSAPDKVQSRLRPTYSFVSHIMELEGSDGGFDNVVERSFLREQLVMQHEKKLTLTKQQTKKQITEPLTTPGASIEKNLNRMKKQFKDFALVMQLPELECFTKVEDKLAPTLKGSIVANARGVDGLVFAETLLNAPLEKLKPSQLATIACYLTQGNQKNENLKIEGSTRPAIAEAKNTSKSSRKEKIQTVKLDTETSSLVENIEAIKAKIQNIEVKNKIYNPKNLPNLQAAPFIQKWAEEPFDIPVEESLKNWEKVVGESVTDKFDEGDFFKSINSTTDILQQMHEACNFVAEETKNLELQTKMKTIAENATIALQSLKKPPIAVKLGDEIGLLSKIRV